LIDAIGSWVDKGSTRLITQHKDFKTKLKNAHIGKYKIYLAYLDNNEVWFINYSKLPHRIGDITVTKTLKKSRQSINKIFGMPQADKW